MHQKQKSLAQLIQNLPKAELHLHIEGTLEPELLFKIAKRNQISLPYKSVAALRQAYRFNNLQDFLDIYYQGARVLETEHDFFDLTWAYLEKAANQNIKHTEIFFDPQTHTQRGIAFKIVVGGIGRALDQAQRTLGLSTRLIMCFLRHLGAKAAMETLKRAVPYKEKIVAVGLDSSEVGHPPSKFVKVFRKARKLGFFAVAHAGEEGPASYVWEALNLLKVFRIDHGNHALDDAKLVRKIGKEKIPLTLCPLSNWKLKVVSDLQKHPLKQMLQKGLLVTINSDDPAYFGGYLNENFLAIAEALKLNRGEILLLARNSFLASLLPAQYQKRFLSEMEKCV